jgi:hypothetical protein
LQMKNFKTIMSLIFFSRTARLNIRNNICPRMDENLRLFF